MMGSYTEKSEQALTKMLRDIPLGGFDSVDSDALTEAARKAQENVTWRKVAPYFAEAYIVTFGAMSDEPTTEVLVFALLHWVEAQPAVFRILVNDYAAAHVGLA